MDKKELTWKLININNDLEEIKHTLKGNGFEEAADLIKEALYNINAAAENFNMAESEEAE